METNKIDNSTLKEYCSQFDQILKQEGLTKKQERSLIYEAFRRAILNRNIIKDRPLEDAWLGLGTFAEYKTMTQKGYFVPISNESTRKGIANWYFGTNKTISIIEKFYSVIDPKHQEMMDSFLERLY